ncbi:DUF4194 domain-containing protein [Pseudonocardia sp.]|uniref:DUF4194 domain-containing protein n=1 Tax=Pseudonocardia sp. TaxID=60912 RepID=UPI003D0BC848
MGDGSTFAEVFDDALFPDADLPAVALDPADVFDHDDATAVGTHVDGGSREPRFDGDTSRLPAELCWTLQALLAAPHVSERDRKYWPVLLQHGDVLRSRLSELGLILEVNHEHRYAFTRQADDPSPHSRIILRAKKLSLAASTLALFLYRQYLTTPEEPVVATGDMVDHMMAYKRAEDTDEKAFRDKIAAAITALEKAAIVKPIPGTDRYLIYGVITSILTADRVEALQRRYRAIAKGGNTLAAVSEDEHDPVDGEDADENA